jgi:hypothetical protein
MSVTVVNLFLAGLGMYLHAQAAKVRIYERQRNMNLNDFKNTMPNGKITKKMSKRVFELILVFHILREVLL